MSDDIKLGQVSKMLHDKTLSEICAYFNSLKELHGPQAKIYTERDDPYCDVYATLDEEKPEAFGESDVAKAEALLRAVCGDYEYIAIKGPAADRLLEISRGMEPIYTANSLHLYEERYEIEGLIYAMLSDVGQTITAPEVFLYRKRQWKYS